jgi:hypothetical protein
MTKSVEREYVAQLHQQAHSGELALSAPVCSDGRSGVLEGSSESFSTGSIPTEWARTAKNIADGRV